MKKIIKKISITILDPKNLDPIYLDPDLFGLKSNILDSDPNILDLYGFISNIFDSDPNILDLLDLDSI